MRIHADIDSAWLAILTDLLRYGSLQRSRNGDTYEILGYAFKLDDPRRSFLANETRRLSPSYACAETIWYLSGDSDGEMIRRYAPSYEKFLEKDGTAYGAYGPRIVPQLPFIAATLRGAPHSRQAVLSIWCEREILEKASVENATKDVPCTVSFKFYVRNQRLTMITDMRSNDAWLGLPYDVFAFTCIQRVLATELGVGIGQYIHQAGSMHLYERDRQNAEIAIRRFDDRSFDHGWSLNDSFSTVGDLVSCERAMRLGYGLSPGGSFNQLGDMFRDMLLCCARRIAGAHRWDVPRSAALRAGELLRPEDYE